MFQGHCISFILLTIGFLVFITVVVQMGWTGKSFIVVVKGVPICRLAECELICLNDEGVEFVKKGEVIAGFWIVLDQSLECFDGLSSASCATRQDSDSFSP